MDYIILNHNHYNHLERNTLENWGIDKNRITELGWGDKFSEEGIEIKGEEANHFSGRYLNIKLNLI